MQTCAQVFSANSPTERGIRRELLGKIRENHNYDGIRVFAVTADVEFTKKPESIPFDGFVIKPVTLKSLGEILA